jgi:hypothetical protein
VHQGFFSEVAVHGGGVFSALPGEIRRRLRLVKSAPWPAPAGTVPISLPP